MNVKREIIALGIRLLSDKTNLVRKPDSFELFLNAMFTGETYDQKLARQVEAELDRGVEITKQKIIDHKFKKLTKNL